MNELQKIDLFAVQILYVKAADLTSEKVFFLDDKVLFSFEAFLF